MCCFHKQFPLEADVVYCVAIYFKWLSLPHTHMSQHIHLLTTDSRTSQAEWWQQQGWQVTEFNNTDQPPGVGRNRMLQAFYQSDQEWLCMCDDDVILDTRWGDTEYFLKHTDQVLAKIPRHINIVVPLNPTVIRLQHTLSQPIYSTHWRLERETFPTGKLVWHRRSRLIQQHTHIPALEDSIWGFEHWLGGGCVMRLNNIVLKEKSQPSSLFGKTGRNTAYQTAREQFLKMYPDVTVNKLGHIMKWNYIKTHSTTHPRFCDLPKTHTHRV